MLHFPWQPTNQPSNSHALSPGRLVRLFSRLLLTWFQFWYRLWAFCLIWSFCFHFFFLERLCRCLFYTNYVSEINLNLPVCPSMGLSVWAAVHPSIRPYFLSWQQSQLPVHVVRSMVWFPFISFEDGHPDEWTDGRTDACISRAFGTHCVRCCFLVWNGQQAKFAAIVDSMTIVTAVGLPIHLMYLMIMMRPSYIIYKTLESCYPNELQKQHNSTWWLHLRNI